LSAEFLSNSLISTDFKSAFVAQYNQQSYKLNN